MSVEVILEMTHPNGGRMVLLDLADIPKDTLRSFGWYHRDNPKFNSNYNREGKQFAERMTELLHRDTYMGHQTKNDPRRGVHMAFVWAKDVEHLLIPNEWGEVCP